MSVTEVPAATKTTVDPAEVPDLYGAHAIRVRRLVQLNVSAAEALVEDACQVAWLRLLRNHGRVERATAVGWVTQVAVNEARRLAVRASRECSLDELTRDDAEPAVAGECDAAPHPATSPDLIEDLAAARARLGTLATLPERQRRLVWLQGLGFSYAEMAGATGETRRTVERQLRRARRRLAAEGG